jgi:hypothetical protein
MFCVQLGSLGDHGCSSEWYSKFLLAGCCLGSGRARVFPAWCSSFFGYGGLSTAAFGKNRQ